MLPTTKSNLLVSNIKLLRTGPEVVGHNCHLSLEILTITSIVLLMFVMSDKMKSLCNMIEK